MGRTSIPNINIAFSRDIYNSCWRALQSGTRFGTESTPANLSLCSFLDYQDYPYVVGTNRASNTNYGICSYWKNRGYFFYLKAVNSSQAGALTIGMTTPAASVGYGAPYSPSSTSSALGAIVQNGGHVSAQSSYFALTAVVNSGYTFNGWYTASSGGSLITSSTNYNVYYNYSNLINNNIWYAQTQTASPPAFSAILYRSPSTATVACQGSLGPGAISTTIWIGTTSPGWSGSFSVISGPLYTNSSLTTYAPVGIYSNTNTYRFSSGATLGPAAFCPGGSDRRLKKNIKLVGKSFKGLNIYTFEYKNKYKKLLGEGKFQGVMSDEIPLFAVIKNYIDNYDGVDYSKIDVKFKSV